MARPWLKLETQMGEPYRIGERNIYPFVRSLRIALPFFNYRLAWNRPVSILVREPDGSEQVLPVPDLTRQMQWTLFGAGFAALFLVWLLRRSGDR